MSGYDRSRGYHDGQSYSRGRYNGGDRDELKYRMMEANRRMEDTSHQCVKLLRETMQMAGDTSDKLERQAKSLDRTEQRLDEMGMDLECSRRNVREVKSVFGSLVNKFSKPKLSKDPPPKKTSSSSSKACSAQGGQKQQQQVQVEKKSTGNNVVDRNLDFVEVGLRKLKGQAHLIGHQLDEKSDQIDRIKTKMDCRLNDMSLGNYNYTPSQIVPLGSSLCLSQVQKWESDPVVSYAMRT